MGTRFGASVALTAVALSLLFSSARPAEAGDTSALRIDATSVDRAGLAGGEEITVMGAGFGPGTTVVLGDAAGTDVVVEDATHLHFRVPPQKAPGLRTLTVRNNSGLDQSPFRIVPPSLSALGPCEITTVAGGIGYVGDSYPATGDDVALTPRRVAIAANGDVYVADSTNRRVRRIDAISHDIFTIAGSGRAGDDGDGGPAVAAAFIEPTGVAVDASANLFVSDGGANRVRRVDAVTGVVTTVLGTGEPGFSGDGGPATAAALSYPADVALDTAGNLFVSDAGNGRIRRVDAATGVVTTVAGGGAPDDDLGDDGPAVLAFLSPDGLDVDAAGNVFIAELYRYRVRHVDARTGVITTVAGDGTYHFDPLEGPATEVPIVGPHDVAAAADGSFYVVSGDEGSDAEVPLLRKVDPSGYISVVRPEGDVGFASGVALDGRSNIYVAEPTYGRVSTLDAASGAVATLAGAMRPIPYAVGDGSVATDDAFGSVSDFDVTPGGDLYLLAGVASFDRVDAASGLVSDHGPDGQILRYPYATSIAVDADGNVYTGSYQFLGDAAVARRSARDDRSKLLVGGGSETIRPGVAGQRVRLSSPANVAVSDSGKLYVSSGSGLLAVAPKSGKIRKVLGGDGYGKFVVGSDGDLYVAAGYRVGREAPGGSRATIAGTGSETVSGDGGPAIEAGLGYVRDVAVDRDGNVYILAANRVRRVDAATGIITTVAGGDDASYSGDGGPASAARFADAVAIAIDRNGVVYVLDDLGIVRAIRAGCDGARD